MKMILAALLAGTFLISLPVRADEKAGDKTEKAEKGKKEKGKKDEKAEKSGGGGW